MRNLPEYKGRSLEDLMGELRSELNNSNPEDLAIILDICNAIVNAVGLIVFKAQVLPYLKAHTSGYLNRFQYNPNVRVFAYHYTKDEPLFSEWTGFFSFLEKFYMRDTDYSVLSPLILNYNGTVNLNSFGLTGGSDSSSVELDHIKSLLVAPFFAHIRHLDLSYLYLDDDLVELVCDSGFSGLVSLDLSANGITYDGVSMIEQAVRSGKFPELKSLTLQYCRLDGDCLSMMADSEIFFDFDYIDITENDDIGTNEYCDAYMVADEDSPFSNSIYRTYSDQMIDRWD